MATKERKVKEKIVDTVEPSWTGIGYDIFLDPDTRTYYRVDIEYDKNSGQARVKEISPVADSQPVATRKMNELFTRKVLGLPFE